MYFFCEATRFRNKCIFKGKERCWIYSWQLFPTLFLEKWELNAWRLFSVTLSLTLYSPCLVPSPHQSPTPTPCGQEGRWPEKLSDLKSDVSKIATRKLQALVPGIVTSIHTESRVVFTRGWGEGKVGELLFNGYRISVWDDEKVLEMGSSDGCTTVWMTINVLKFYVSIIPQ